VSNWWFIAQDSSYFARFGPPSPLGHLWSLAVEEQFYLVWPALLWLGLRYTRGRQERTRRYLLACAALLLAAGSIAAMAMLYHPGYDPTRVYEGTDTRAFGLLIGAALAFARPSRLMPAEVSRRSRLLLDGVGTAGLVVIALLVWRTSQYSPFLYRGGIVLLSVATAAVVWAVASPAGRLGRVLGAQPLRWLGVRSYGIYLWHYPIIVLTTPANGSDSSARAALQVAASIAVAALSWRFIEEPIRHGAIGRWLAKLRAGTWRSAPRRGWAAVTAAVGVLALAGAALGGAVPAASAGQPSAADLISASGPGSGAGQGGASQGGASQGGISQGGASGPGSSAAFDQPGGGAGGLASGGAGERRSGVPQTSCRSVVHIGDSTSDGLISPDYLPDPAQRIGAQYADVGVKRTIFEISGGRSIVETLPGQPNAYTVAQQLVGDGYRGCWVLALGTNDTADVYVGSTVSLATRIRRMMSAIGDEPVLWVNVKSLLASGPYSEHDMQLWNQALLQACARYPNMHVYDWAAFARPAWFISDGIHYTSAGYAARSAMIAAALAEAFPASAAPLTRAEDTAGGFGGSSPRPDTEGAQGCLVY
jgi:peptidoglycan/LPS O-acetylase OafA/YrhL